MLLQRGQQRRLGHVLHINVQRGLNIQAFFRTNFGAIVNRLPVVTRHFLEQSLAIFPRQKPIEAILQPSTFVVFIDEADSTSPQVGKGFVANVDPLKHDPTLVASGAKERPGFHFLFLKVVDLSAVEQHVSLAVAAGLVDSALIGLRALVLKVLRQQ